MLAMLAMLAENLWIEVLDLTSGLKTNPGSDTPLGRWPGDFFGSDVFLVVDAFGAA